MEVHNGNSVGFWTDLWHPIGRLIEAVGEKGTQKLDILRNARITEVLVDNQWRFRNTRDSNIQNVTSQIKEFPLNLQQNEEDRALWKRSDDEYRKEF